MKKKKKVIKPPEKTVFKTVNFFGEKRYSSVVVVKGDLDRKAKTKNFPIKSYD